MKTEDLVEMVEQASLCKPREFIDAFHKLERFAALVASAEREACAEMVDSYVGFDSELSEAIRARGEA
jgi:hypothetical protein